MINWRTAVLVAISWAAAMGYTVPTAGQENNARFTATRWADVDEDFRFLGEFQGVLRDIRGCNVNAGLQVAPIGNGEFIGVRYACGLPGTGWNRVEREELTGKREGDVVRLVGEHSQVEVRHGAAIVNYADGLLVGHLPKVNRRSPTLGVSAPANAYTLFDGTNTDQFKGGRINDEGWLEEGTELASKFRDYTLHIEFRLPYMPNAKEQGRANSGVYLQSSYEVQILDSFALEGKFNECGALYRYRAPNLNMCLPPLAWQTYDLTFISPRFDAAGNKSRNGRITVLHNGVAIHEHFELERKTGAGKTESVQLWPIKLQDHGNPVRFRNIWLIDLERSATSCWPEQNGVHSVPTRIGMQGMNSGLR